MGSVLGESLAYIQRTPRIKKLDFAVARFIQIGERPAVVHFPAELVFQGVSEETHLACRKRRTVLHTEIVTFFPDDGKFDLLYKDGTFIPGRVADLHGERAFAQRLGSQGTHVVILDGQCLNLELEDVIPFQNFRLHRVILVPGDVFAVIFVDNGDEIVIAVEFQFPVGRQGFIFRIEFIVAFVKDDFVILMRGIVPTVVLPAFRVRGFAAGIADKTKKCKRSKQEE